jgi:hypothetical protein
MGVVDRDGRTGHPDHENRLRAFRILILLEKLVNGNISGCRVKKQFGKQ